MQLRDDARLPICADLFTQIEQLEQDCRSMTLPALHEAIDEIRTKAVAYDLVALEGIAHAFERSVARNRQATTFSLYFDQLKLATGCAATNDPRARDAMLAAISVRLTG